MMEPDRIRSWMASPSETEYRDAIALLRAYHAGDSEGLATLLENCDASQTLKALIAFWEITVELFGSDPCDLLESIVVTSPDGGS